MPRIKKPTSVDSEANISYRESTGKFHVEIERVLSNGQKRRLTTAFVAKGRDDVTALSKAIAKRDSFLEELEQAEQGTLVTAVHTVQSWGNQCHGEDGKLGIWHQNGDVRATTQYQHYRNLVRYCYPTCGDIELGKLTSKHVRDIIRKMELDGLDGDTRANVRNSISKLYSTALEECEHDTARRFLPLNYNPTKPVKVKRKAKKRDGDGNVIQHKRVLSPEEQTNLLTAAKDHRVFGMVLIGLKMGLRRGEILAFSAHNIDWERRTYHVCEQIVRIVGVGLRVESLKREWQERTVPIPAPVWDWLLTVKSEAQSHRWLFTNMYDEAIPPEDFTKWFGVVARKARLKGNKDGFGRPLADPSIHDMRHSYASTLANVHNVKPQVLARLVGDSVAVAMEYYVDASHEDMAAAVAVLV